jgi:hypothetical protein
VIIDAHTHIFSPQIISRRDEYIRRDPCFARLYSNPKAKLVTVQELLISMDRFEIETSAVAGIGWSTHELCREGNDYLLDCLARYPQRLIGLASLQPKSGEETLKELERCVQGGVKGIGEMRPDLQDFDLSDEGVLADVITILVSHNLIWLSHASEPVGHNYPGKGSVTPELLYPFILRNPKLKIILAHWGGGLPFYALMPEVKTALTNVFFDTAASPYLYRPDVYGQALDILGETNILFGSDYPLMSPDRVIKEISQAGLSENARTAILGGNARRAFNLS